MQFQHSTSSYQHVKICSLEHEETLSELKSVHCIKEILSTICYKTNTNVSICNTNFGIGAFLLICVNGKSAPDTQQTYEVMLQSNWHCSPSNSGTTLVGVYYTMPEKL
jgi:hypothetical protein